MIALLGTSLLGMMLWQVPYTKATLPDVDRRDINTILDLSSGEFQRNLIA